MDIVKLFEGVKEVYDYGCVMLDFNFVELFEIHMDLDVLDVVSYEDHPHCTLLYGIHDWNVHDLEIETLINQYTFTTCKLHNFSFFENSDYDVLKMDVVGDNLHEINSKLNKLPNSNEYPEYKPHLTIAYLNPGTGKKYAEKLNRKYGEFWVPPTQVIYSKSDGTKKKINIMVD